MRTFRLLLGSVALLVTAACSVASTNEKAAANEGDLIGGEVQDAPFMSTLVLRGNCTAARVGPRHILTAAHCVWGTGSLDAQFAAGKTLKYTNDPALNDPDLFAGTQDANQKKGPPPLPASDGGAADTDAGDAPTDIDAGPAVVVPRTKWLEAKIAKVEVDPAWKKQCVKDESASCLSIASARTRTDSDVAVILLDADLPSEIPIVPVDLDPVFPGDTLNLVGYGCETSVADAQQHDYTHSRAKVQNTVSIPKTFMMHDGSFIAIGEDAIASTVDQRYFLTPGPALREGQAGLCPGDSGGPVYRAGDQPAIVGVNANYTFNGDVEGGYSSPVSNWHTRLDEKNANGVGAWLEKLGVEVTRSCSKYPNGCVDNGYTGSEFYPGLRGFDAGAPPVDGGAAKNP